MSAPSDFDLGFQAGIKRACDIALDLETMWRASAKRHRETRKRWFFGWYTDPIADRGALSIEAAADGIRAIRDIAAATPPRAGGRK